MAKTRHSETGRAADKLYQHFVELIRSGQLGEGDTLPPEREIVERHGVSRTVVRETVQALANKGLVKARPRFRPVVRRPDFDVAFDTVDAVVSQLLTAPGGVRNLFETRILVEAALVREAALNATALDLEALSAALDANKAAREDNAMFFRTDTTFHGVLYQISRNPVLLSVHRAYTSWLAPQWSKMPRHPVRNARNYRSHEAIFEGIEKRDADAAEAALRSHLDDAWAQVRSTFDL